jgi:hypothetical protein
LIFTLIRVTATLIRGAFSLIRYEPNLLFTAAVTTAAILFLGQLFFTPSLLHLGHLPYPVKPEIPLLFFHLLCQLSLMHLLQPAPLCLGNTSQAPP